MSHISPIILLLLTATPVFCQNFLDPLFVTASRSEQKGSETAYSTAYIDEDFIRENTRRTLPEALQYTPGVLVQKTTHGHGSPYIRGFTGRQNLLLVDGVRLNNSTLRSGPVQYWNTVDAFSINHLELTKSQGSVLYGSDAIGGTLNGFTKSSDFRARTEDEVYLGGSAYYEYRSNGQGSHLGRLETETGVGGKFGVWLGLSAKDFGDIEDSAVGRMKGTSYPEQDLDFRADWAVTPDSTITLAHQYVNQDDISRWHRSAGNPGWIHDEHETAAGSWKDNTYDQERSLTYLRYAGDNTRANAPIQRWGATLSYQTSADSEYQDRTGDPNAGGRPIRRSNIDLETYGVDLSLESAAGPGSFVYGLDYYRDEVDSSGYQVNAAGTNFRESLPVADDSSYDLFGAFAQYTWKPVEQWEITAGTRYTHAEASLGRFIDSTGAPQTNVSDDWDSVVGSIRGLYRINTCWSLFAGISQSFRAPNLDDLTGNMTTRAGSDSLGSTDVDSEKYLTYEIGTRHSTDTTSLQASVFYTDAKDMITSVASAENSTTFVTTNASDAYVYGIELEGAWRFHPQWTLSGFAAWQDGRTESPDYLDGPVDGSKPMSRQLPLTGSLALRWTDSSEKFWIEGRLLAAATEDRVTAQDQDADKQRIPTHGTPGYIVASLHAGWQVNDHFDLTCGIENLMDEDYRNHGSGQNEPGLSGIIGARVSW
ncbi:MAG: TonB-dependent receptor [Luteolibacter sp.]|jgi:hemoglobin/transferrin/lactoferrin receptor protein|nr:TonB-dependent receptor [Luteolibacter sp.]